MAGGLTASMVVATRNRPAALEMSLPLMLAQTRRPRQIVVVDSSDDPRPTAAIVDALEAPDDVSIALLRSAPGLTRQRNLGIDASAGDIIVFPDDDSLLFPEALATIMEVYEADTAGCVGGVTVAASAVSPLVGESASYAAKAHGGRLATALADAYVFFENRVMLRPFARLSREARERRVLPSNLGALGYHAAADLEGFRMSFRRTVFDKCRFNENLTNYALGEDKDISYAVAKDWLLVEVPRHLIFHHEFPGPRHGGFRRGVVEVLNEAYIVCAHTEPGAPARRAIRSHGVTLIAQTGLRATSRYQRERLRGIVAAQRKVGRLIRASGPKLDAMYVGLTRELLGD